MLGHAVTWSPTLRPASAVTGGLHYVYLRITSESGRVAWTAPIWTTQADEASGPSSRLAPCGCDQPHRSKEEP